MKITIDMPVVSNCEVTECAYNVENRCHARAITVGDGIHPGCDTFLDASQHTRNKQQMAGVGACKVASCIHNDDFECVAEQIDVGRSGGSINCLTYATA